MILLVAWVLMCALVAAIANKKGQSGVGFFFLALFLSPLVGLIAVAIVKANPAASRPSRSEAD